MKLRKWALVSDVRAGYETTYSSRHFTESGARRRAASMNRYTGGDSWAVMYDPTYKLRSTKAHLEGYRAKRIGDKGNAKNIPVFREVR